MDAGAAGLSSGPIYAPGSHADAAEVRALATAATRRGGLYATHLRNEADGFDALDEAVSPCEPRPTPASTPRGSKTHLKCASRRSTAGWGGHRLLDRARSDGLDIGADQYPYTAAATT